MQHGEKQTRKIKVGNGAIYTKSVQFCEIHGWIDTFTCDFERFHTGCGADDVKPSAVGMELPKAMSAAA